MSQTRRRRVRALVIGVVAAVAVLLAALWIISGPLLGISGVTVRGYRGPDRPAVQRTAELVAGTGTMVRLPAGDMRRALTRFPGIADVSIQREWPRSITVIVTMDPPIAILAVDGGGRYLLAPNGQVIGTADARGGLPVIHMKQVPTGGMIVAPVPRAALRFIGWLPPEIAGRLRNIRAVGGRLVADLSGGPELRIGLPEKLVEKAQALAAVLSQADPKELAAAAYLDISSPTRPMLGSRASRTVTTGVGASGTTTGGQSTGQTSTDGTGTIGTTGAVDQTGAGTNTTLKP